MKMYRIEANGDYLIIAPKGEPEYGYYHTLTERAYLVDNLINFIHNHPDIDAHQIAVYELREVNLGSVSRANNNTRMATR